MGIFWETKESDLRNRGIRTPGFDGRLDPSKLGLPLFFSFSSPLGPSKIISSSLGMVRDKK